MSKTRLPMRLGALLVFFLASNPGTNPRPSRSHGPPRPRLMWSAAVLFILFTPSFEGSLEGPSR